MDRCSEHSWSQAAWIGTIQILSAVFPGVSRSMSTIAAGQLAGLTRAAALEFSFFVSIPVMLAVCGYKLLEALSANHVPAEYLGGRGAQWGVVATGFLVSFVVAWAVIAWFIMTRSVFGYQMRVVGAAPHAARYGGFSENKTIWLALLVSGGLAGLAGMLEVAGPFQRMVPGFPTNYGFTAIIVAFLGRLNPLGVIFAGIVMAITFVGGEVAQTSIGLSSSATGVFQAMMLFFLLAGDILVRYRLKRVVPQGEARA